MTTYTLQKGTSAYEVIVMAKSSVEELGSSIKIVEHVATFDVTKKEGSGALAAFVVGALRKGTPVEDIGGFALQAQINA